MRRWLAAPVVFFAVIGLATFDAPRVAAQPAPKEESFATADGVQLKGVFHATNKDASSAAVVVLLYPPGTDRDMTKGDWVGLAKKLNEAGYNVFRFDWRGHGKSTEIKDPVKFWDNPFLNGNNTNYNGYIKGAGKKPLKDDINVKDVTRPDRFLPAYLNDLAAVRLHLDSKNDKSTLNTSSIYLIGAGDAAYLGLAWMTSEWQRPAVFPTGKLGMMGLTPIADYRYVPHPITGEFPPEAGKDIAGAVWLSASRPTTGSVAPATIQKWVSTQSKLRTNNPMLFLYADKDTKGKPESEFFYKNVLVAEPPKGSPLKPLKQTFLKEVKGAAQKSGVGLLDGAELKVQDDIVTFLNSIQKERADLTQTERSYKVPYYIDLRHYGFAP